MILISAIYLIKNNNVEMMMWGWASRNKWTTHESHWLAIQFDYSIENWKGKIAFVNWIITSFDYCVEHLKKMCHSWNELQHWLMWIKNLIHHRVENWMKVALTNWIELQIWLIIVQILWRKITLNLCRNSWISHEI